MPGFSPGNCDTTWKASGGGAVLFWSLKNPFYPERALKTTAGVDTHLSSDTVLPIYSSGLICGIQRYVPQLASSWYAGWRPCNLGPPSESRLTCQLIILLRTSRRVVLCRYSVPRRNLERRLEEPSNGVVVVSISRAEVRYRT